MVGRLMFTTLTALTECKLLTIYKLNVILPQMHAVKCYEKCFTETENSKQENQCAYLSSDCKTVWLLATKEITPKIIFLCLGPTHF